jgi:protein SCO1/2
MNKGLIFTPLYIYYGFTGWGCRVIRRDIPVLRLQNKQGGPPSCLRGCPGQADKSARRGWRLCLPAPVIWLLPLLCLVFVQTAAGHISSSSQPIGIEERIGETVPASLAFFDEQGRQAILGELIRKPTILVPVYYTCSRFCPQLLAGLASALPQLGLTADKDYQVVTVSFDAADTPALARDLKRNYVMAVGRPFPPDGWRFLTSDQKNIEKLCTAVGFTFRKEHEGFSHPVALIILSPDRRITRYIHVSKFAYGVEYPITFSAIGLSQALTAASQGRLGAPTGKEFLYCFPHEPYRQQGFYHILAWLGAATIFCLVLFFVYLAWIGKKPRKERGA